jgi:hypothetical protein
MTRGWRFHRGECSVSVAGLRQKDEFALCFLFLRWVTRWSPEPVYASPVRLLRNDTALLRVWVLRQLGGYYGRSSPHVAAGSFDVE